MVPSKKPKLVGSAPHTSQAGPSTRRDEIPVGNVQRSDEVPVGNVQGTDEIPVENVQRSDEIPVGNVQSETFDIVWTDPDNRNQVFTHSLQPSFDPQLVAELKDATPFGIFNLFVDTEIIDMMVHETNRYATQTIINRIVDESLGPSSRLSEWVDTNRIEMMKFLGILGYMGLVQLSDMRKYWSTSFLYRFGPCASVMSRNRFELLLAMWHFSNNEECPENDRTFKLRSLTEKMIGRFSSLSTPGETVCVDESMIPFRGRLIIRQYMPNKAHKYGVKIFKLCCNKGYTWNLKIYEGKEKVRGGNVPTNIVMDLSEKLLGEGRTIVTDNYYTSIDLAKKLLQRQTHLLGTLRKNRKHLPKAVVTAKLKKGEVIAKQSGDGITILKWMDKREVLALSTKHGDEMVEVKTKRGMVNKPMAIAEYNEGKGHIDISDQMSAYNSSLRKSLRWYKKIAVELIFGTALVNSHIMFKKISGGKITITDFKEKIVEQLLKFSEPSPIELPVAGPSVARRSSRHELLRKEGDNRKVRRGCKGCKIKKINGQITKNKIKKVVSYCPLCPGEPFFCTTCFSENHSNL